jgi:hypothetical protein
MSVVHGELVRCAVRECQRPAEKDCRIVVQLVYPSGMSAWIEVCTCHECYTAFTPEIDAIVVEQKYSVTVVNNVR